MSDVDTGSMNGWHALGIDHSEADGPRNNAAKTRGRPFTAGNSGRPKGALNRTTLAAQALLDGKAKTITSKLIELAEAGDIYAIKLCMDVLFRPAKSYRSSLPCRHCRHPLISPQRWPRSYERWRKARFWLHKQ